MTANFQRHFFEFIATEYNLILSGDLIEDGNFHYLQTDQDRKGRKPFRYIVNLDEPENIHYRDLKRGINGTWFPREFDPISPAEREARRKAAADNQAKREAETLARHERRAAWAAKIWESAKPAEYHKYLEIKHIRAHGIRYVEQLEWRTYHDNNPINITLRNALIIPSRDIRARLWNLQIILTEENEILGTNKLFLPGAKMNGLFHYIGKRTKDICLAEGYATAATIHEATGYRSIAAFSAGNLPYVAKNVREVFPDGRIVICADYDKADQRGRRAGIEKAEEAAKLVDGVVAIPPVEGFDFNDYFISKGVLNVQKTA